MTAGPSKPPSRPPSRSSNLRAYLAMLAATLAIGVGLGLLASWIRGPAPARERASGDPQPRAAGGAPAWPGEAASPFPRATPGSPPQPRPASTGRRTPAAADLIPLLQPLAESASRCAAGSSRAGGGAPRQVWVTLDVQTLDGAVRIVDATPQRGTSSRLVSCVRAEMVGRQVALAEVRAGGTFKLPYPMRD